MIERSSASDTDAQRTRLLRPQTVSFGDNGVVPNSRKSGDQARTECRKTRTVPRRSQTESEACKGQGNFLRNRPKIFERYKPLREIGKGAFGTVLEVAPKHICSSPSLNDNRSHSTLACKILPVDVHMSPERLDDLVNEVRLLMESTGHPNVQNLVDFSIDQHHVCIVSSLCRGGDLNQALELRGSLCEEDAKSVMGGLLRGVSFLHSRGVVHRDLKMENILLVGSRHDLSKVKIIDMGFAKKIQHEDCDEVAMHTVCGTPLYIAPEMVRPTNLAGAVKPRAHYGTQADMWSCGIILFYLLAGYPPFSPTGKTSILELFGDIADAAYDFTDPMWDIISDEAKDMVERLLEADPEKRLTAEEALQHTWMMDC